MIPVSNAFKTAAKSLAKTALVEIKLEKSGSSVTLDPFTIQSCSIERSACASSTYTLGSTVSASFEAKVLSSALFVDDPVTHQRVPMNLDRAKVTLKGGYVVNGSNVMITLGTFYLDDSETEDSGLFTTIKGYDLFMSKSFDTLISSDFVFDAEASPYDNVTALKNAYGTGLQWDYSALPQTDGTPIVINEDLTLREVIGRIAIAAGCNCMITPDNKIKFVYPNFNILETLNTRNFKDCRINGKDNTYVTFLVVGSDENAVQYPNEPELNDSIKNVGLSFDAVYFGEDTDAALRVIASRAFTQTIGTVSNCFYYQGHSLDCMGVIYVEPMDCVYLTDVTDAHYNLIPLTVKHTYNGAWRTNLGATTISATSDSQATVTVQVNAATQPIKTAVTRVQNAVRARYGTCNTAGVVSLKNVVLPDFEIYDGATVAVKFLYANEANEVSMTVNGSAPKTVCANGTPLTENSVYNWRDGDIVNFLYAGGQWQIVEANVANYMTFDNGVLCISQDRSAERFHTDIGADYIALKYNTQENLKITDGGVVIGANPNHRMTIDSTGLEIKNGYNYVNVRDNGVNLISANVVTPEEPWNQNVVTIANGTMTSWRSETKQTTYSLPNDKEEGAERTTSNYVWEKRANGHLSLKVV